jgi:Mor family transcriptional regulator
MPMHYCSNCGHPVNVTQDERDQVVERWKAGESITELARAFKRSRTSIYQILEPHRHLDDVHQATLFPTKED